MRGATYLDQWADSRKDGISNHSYGSIKMAKAAKPVAKHAAAKPTAAAKPPAVARAQVALPANARALMDADVAALASKLAAPTGKAIQVTQSKQFRFPDGNTVSDFRGIIVGFVSQNAYYEGDFDRDNIVPPNCFAIGVTKNDELERSENSPDPQPEDGAMDCKSCWANQWKSATKGDGKACKNSIKIAVLCDDGDVRPLNISSTALKPFGEYVRQVVQAFGVAPYGVMTEFGFAASDYSSVRCSNPLKLNDEQLAQVFSLRDDAMAMLMAEPDVSEFEEKVVAARAKPVKGKATSKRA